MAKKLKATKKYDNLPIPRDGNNTYEMVRMIADANNRSMGGQVKHWVKRELPDCEHEKIPVTIETFQNPTHLNTGDNLRNGWMCTICNRVYMNYHEFYKNTPVIHLEAVDSNNRVTQSIDDPYGQPIKMSNVRTKKRVKKEAVLA